MNTENKVYHPIKKEDVIISDFENDAGTYRRTKILKKSEFTGNYTIEDFITNDDYAAGGAKEDRAKSRGYNVIGFKVSSVQLTPEEIQRIKGLL